PLDLPLEIDLRERTVEHEHGGESDRDDKPQHRAEDGIEAEWSGDHQPPRASLRGGRNDLRSGWHGNDSSRKMRRRSGWPSNSMPNMSYVSRSGQFAPSHTAASDGSCGSSSVHDMPSITKTFVSVPRPHGPLRSSAPVSTRAF